ncbi:MAG: hypothetical protein HC859_08685 [Bacteroidia bacterium]|nr:hypothetical protein [Bacteroidia bacterium]
MIAATTKTDLGKTRRDYYRAGATPNLINIDKTRYLSITGVGDPDGHPFSQRVEGLYAVAYAVKFINKQRGCDFVMPKLEGLWWFDEQRFGGVSMETAPRDVPRAHWRYRLLIQMPEFVELGDLPLAIETVKTKKSLRQAEDVLWHELMEGACVQVLHTGPFGEEGKSLGRLANFMTNNGLTRNGLHHEIYLSDFRRVPPERLKTILREPISQFNRLQNGAEK